MTRIARTSSALTLCSIQARALSTVASRGEPPRRSQLTKDGLPLTSRPNSEDLAPVTARNASTSRRKPGPDGLEPHEGQQPVGGIQARRAAPAEDGDEGRIAQRRLSEAGAAHAALLDEGLDGLPQRCLETCHDRERMWNIRT